MVDEQEAINRLLNDMHMEKVPIEKLIPNEKNPRVSLVPGIPMYEKLKNSIDHFNYMEPIIWNKRSGKIVAGHQRFAVLKAIAEERGIELKEVPVVVVDLNEEDENTFMISSNKITGLWDNEKLAELFKVMDDEALKLTGFDKHDIDALIVEPTDDVFGDMEDDPEPITREKKPKLVTCPHCGKEFEP